MHFRPASVCALHPHNPAVERQLSVPEASRELGKWLPSIAGPGAGTGAVAGASDEGASQ